MAKKGRKKRSKSSPKQSPIQSTTVQKKAIETVGWGFWLICFALLFAPSWYLGYTISVTDRKGGVLPWIIGFSLAAFGAGVLSVVLNSILQKRAEMRRKRDHKKK